MNIFQSATFFSFVFVFLNHFLPFWTFFFYLFLILKLCLLDVALSFHPVPGFLFCFFFLIVKIQEDYFIDTSIKVIMTSQILFSEEYLLKNINKKIFVS